MTASCRPRRACAARRAGWPGDPAAFARARGDPAVQRGGELQRDQWTAEADPRSEPRGDLVGLVLQHAFVDRDAGGAQPGDAGTIHARIGVAHGDHHAGHAGADQRVGAGRRPPPVATGLQRDVDGAAARPLARDVQRHRLGVRPAAGRGDGASDHAAVLHHDAADRWIGPGIAETAPRQRQRRTHVRDVLRPVGVRRLGHAHDYVVSPNEPMKSSKSLASRKFR